MQQSPFENIFNIIGGITEGNEKPMKHGFYNAFALFVLTICCAAVYVLFLILEPFFKPLFWALLVGSLLHPFKYKLSRKIKTWFENLEKNNNSMVVALMLTPVNVVNFASDTVGYQFREHYKTIIALLSTIFILPWIYNGIPRSLGCIFWQLISFIGFSTSLLINVCSSYITLTIALAYIISVYTLWSPSRSGFFRITSHILWLVIASFLSNLAGSYRVYMFVLLQTIGVTGFILEVLHVHKQLQLQDPEASILTALHDVITCTSIKVIEKKPEEKPETIPEDSEKESTPDTESPNTPEGAIIKRGSWTNEENPLRSTRNVKILKEAFKTRTMSALPLGNTKARGDGRPYRQQSLDDNYIRNNFTDDETALYFKLLFFGCFCMLVWKHIWLLPVMLFFLSIHILKNLLDFFGVWLFIENQLNNVKAKIMQWWEERESALLPASIRGVGRMVAICNRSVRDMAYESVDTVSTCIVIVGLIMFLTVATIFICIQIYSEAIVVVQLSGSLLNSTFVQNSELHAYLPEGWEERLDSLIDNAYTYGREGISTGVKSILKEGDPEKIAKVEQQVLEIWDRVYQSWVSGHFAAPGPQVDGSAVQASWDSFVHDVSATPDLFDYSGIVTWVRANVGTLSALASGVWAPLASNVSLLAGSLGAFTSLLLSGSGAIINMFINLVVFFTTLFYLLASSNALYKPVEVITRVQPNFGSRLGIALSVAINQVFRASFKMALFYGLWTWLVHNLFGAKVVYLPSVDPPCSFVLYFYIHNVLNHAVLSAAMLVSLCLLSALLYPASAVRVNFTGCQQPGWSCVANDVVYTCSLVASNDFIVYLKDYHNEQTNNVVIQNCRDLRVVLDCHVLQRSSKLQRFKIKDCDRIEFVTVSGGSVQTPPELTIENVREVVALPRNIIKSPTTNAELKCMGAGNLKLRVVNSKINIINTRAIYNVTHMNSFEFENVTIGDIKTEGIEIVTNFDKTSFAMTNSKIENMDYKAITVQSSVVKLINNDFGDVPSNVINVTAENLQIQRNRFKEISANGITASSVKTDISDNCISVLKTNALSSVKCSRTSNNREMKITNNVIEKVEPLSLYFDFDSCKTNAQVTYSENKINCKCRGISFLNSHNDLNDIILNLPNNNTCLLNACILPVEIVKLLLENDMCHLNLDPQVMCLLYNDRRNSEMTTDTEVTEPAPTFYLIRQANTLQAAGAMTAIDKDDLIRDSNLNITNKTTFKVVFDSSRDFVETLRSTSQTAKVTANKPQQTVEYVNRCVGGQCRNTVQYDKQRALEFYKYVYAQLRTPRPDVKEVKN